MRIKLVHVYGFGRLENYTIKLDRGFQIIYGRNEAGKSTVMAFIRCILFGFPSRQQKDNRYEPKSGGKFGGKLVIDIGEKEEVVIERIKGKSNGEVTVLFSDGSSGGEERLSQIIKDIDKNIYEGIFSFNLQGLQQLETLNADELGRFIFGSGINGGKSILEIENKLEKSQNELYRPQGRKPAINQQLEQVQNIERELKQWQVKNDKYMNLIDKKVKIEKSLEELSNKKQLERKEIHTLEKLKTMQPLFDEQMELYIKQNAIPAEVSEFPIDGLNRLEQIKQLQLPLESQKASLVRKLYDTDEWIKKVSVNERILQVESTINKCTESLGVYRLYKEEYINIKRQLKYIDEEIELAMEKAGLDLDEEKIAVIDTGLVIKQQVKQLEKEMDALDRENQYLKEESKRVTFSLEESNVKLHQLQKACLTEGEKGHLEDRLRTLERFEEKEMEKKFLQEATLRLNNELQELQKEDEKRNKQLRFQVSVFLFAGLILFVWFVYKQLWGLSVIPTLFVLFSLYFSKSLIKKNPSTIRLEEEMLKMNHNLEMYESNHYSGENDINARQIKERLELDDSYQRELEVEKSLNKDIQGTLKKLNENYHEWLNKRQNAEQIKIDMLIKLKLPIDINIQELREIVELIEQMKGSLRKKKQLKQRMGELVNYFHDFDQAVNNISGYFPEEYDERDTIRRLEGYSIILKNEKKQFDQLQKLIEKKEQIEDELREIEVKLGHYEKECSSLFDRAKVDGEEGFREKGEKWEKWVSVQNRLESVEDKLIAIAGGKGEKNQLTKKYKQLTESLETLLQKLLKSVDDMEEEITILVKQLTDIEIQISQLEEGGTYADLLHTFALEKSKLQELTKTWAIYRVAEDILQKQKEKYRNEKLPMLISAAKQYFTYLTDGEYVTIYAPTDEESFIAERVDGSRFYPKELSQATTEQLYLSIRLALAKIYPVKTNYPIIIDDSFVNFDKFRQERALLLLKKIAVERQVLYFTCHSHFYGLFNDNDIINLSDEVLNY